MKNDCIDNPTIRCVNCGVEYVADSLEKIAAHQGCVKKPKTPREIAEEKYPRAIATTDEAYMLSYNDLQLERQDAYLAGLEAGAKMGWEAAEDSTTVFLTTESQVEQSFDEWRASLEKEPQK